jgi:hypothetical protein
MTIRQTIQQLDEKLGFPLTSVVEKARQRKRLTKFEQDRAKRLRQYPGSSNSAEARDLVEKLNRDGFAILPSAVPLAAINAVRSELEARLDTGTGLLPVSDDARREAGDRGAASKFLSATDLAQGQSLLRKRTNYAAVSEPFLTCPSSIPLAFDQRLVDLATAYLRCTPGIGGLNLRKSYRNELPEFDTLYFHVDPNSPKFLKFFFYLNDVDTAGGPFCYVRGSHRSRFAGWNRKYRWELDEIAPIYGKENVLLLTAKAGDIIVADTNGFHRGTKITGHDRGMLTVDYVIHQEFEGAQKPFKLKRSDFDRLTPKQRPAADFLEIVDAP